MKRADFNSSTNLAKIIQEEYQTLSFLPLQIDPEYHSLLIPQSILGRAHEGHGGFRHFPVPNLTMKEIYSALEMDPLEKRERRAQIIYEIHEAFIDLINGRKSRLTNHLGKPLGGLAFLAKGEISFDQGFFMGAAIAGRMDTEKWRKKTVEAYQRTINGMPFQIGCGREYALNEKEARKYNFSPESFSKKALSEEEIKDLLRKKILTNRNANNPGKLETAFVRTQDGNGCCDDACAIATTLVTRNPDAIFAWSLVDAADTYTKFLASDIPGGLDEWLGKEIEIAWERKYGSPLVTPEDTMKVIFAGAKNNSPILKFSSSHRRFIEVEQGQKRPTILIHREWARTGKNPIKFKLGFDRTSSNGFYEAMTERLQKIGITNFLQGREISIKRRKLKRENQRARFALQENLVPI